jgi:hypothetical protein
MLMPSLSHESDTSRLAPIGRRHLNEATQKLPEHPSLSVAIEDYMDPIGWGLCHCGRKKRRVVEFQARMSQLEGRMPTVALAKEEKRIPKP